MEEIKSMKSLKVFLENNDINVVAEFLNNYSNLNNNQILFSSGEEFLESSGIDKKILFQELNFFLNSISNLLNNESSEHNYKEIIAKIEDFISSNFKINYSKQLSSFVLNLIGSLKKKNLGSNLVSYDWQLSILERENEKTSTNMNKLEKLEMAFQFKTFDKKSNNYKSDTIKMGYSEFYEIFQNLKKIDGQLHMFKN
jgi:hypothetical protein